LRVACRRLSFYLFYQQTLRIPSELRLRLVMTLVPFSFS
jgi:hypothetical protein